MSSDTLDLSSEDANYDEQAASPCSLLPRPSSLARAELDSWTDPRGELRPQRPAPTANRSSCWHASPAYQHFGLTGLPSTEPQEPFALCLPIGDPIKDHRRPADTLSCPSIGGTTSHAVNTTSRTEPMSDGDTCLVEE